MFIDMAKSVWILGAGASASFGAPLMNRFIDEADDLRTSATSGIDKAAFDLFFDVLQEGFQRLHAKSSVSLRNIESVFGLVEMASLIGKLPGFDDDKLHKLSQAIRAVLIQTIEQRGRFEYDPLFGYLPPPPYVGLAAAHEEGKKRGEPNPVAFITFNYDIGLDFALHWSNLEIDYGLSEPRPQAVPLLKLHGSLNWSGCSICHQIRALDFGRLFGAYPLRVQSGVARSQRSLPVGPVLGRLPPHCVGATPSAVAAIVPPSWNKTQYASQFGQVWKRAAVEIEEAEEIIIAGYSIPPTDSFFRDLLALSLAGRTRVRKLVVVNTEDSVVGTLRGLMGPEMIDRVEGVSGSFENFVQARFGDTARMKRR